MRKHCWIHPNLRLCLDSFGGISFKSKSEILCGSPLLYEEANIVVKGDHHEIALKMVELQSKFAFLLSGSNLSGNERLRMLEDCKIEEDLSLDQELVYATASKVSSSNCFALDDSRVGIFRYASFLNHSCSSNVDAIRKDSSIFMVAKKDIKADEMPCINYLGSGVLKDHVYRRSGLENWGFLCSCERCLAESEYLDYNLNDLKILNIAYDVLNRKDYVPGKEDFDYLTNCLNWKYLAGIDLVHKVCSLFGKGMRNCKYIEILTDNENFDFEPIFIRKYRKSMRTNNLI
jgi:hypothetical protein